MRNEAWPSAGSVILLSHVRNSSSADLLGIKIVYIIQLPIHYNFIYSVGGDIIIDARLLQRNKPILCIHAAIHRRFMLVCGICIRAEKDIGTVDHKKLIKVPL